MSCTSSKKLAYFGDIEDKTFYGTVKTEQTLIAPADILSITISSLNPEASAIFNPDRDESAKTTSLTGTRVEDGGYLVNSEGFIQLPILGELNVTGLTKDQIKDEITKIILDRKLLKDPLVEVRFLNYEVTILGEVGSPTVITVPSEKISLLKAIGLAGDLTVFGKRENILLIREVDGNRVTKYIDLTSPDFLTSPYYYLEPNDVVYVQPNKARKAQATMWPHLAPILLTSLSVIILLLDRVIQ